MISEAFYLIRYGAADTAFERRPFELPDPAPGQVLIEVKAFGLNFADVMARRGLYKAAPPLPAVLGYEVAGVIVATGSNVSNVKPGQRVLAFTRFGGYSKHILTSSGAVQPLPENIDFPEATALGTQYITAIYAAWHMANIRAGETVLIHAAAGGVGTALMQLAKLKGCEIIAVAGSDSKFEYMRQQGADHVINYRNSDFMAEVRKLKGDRGVDVVFDPIGGKNFKRSYLLLSVGGRIVGYGASDQLNRRKGILSSLKLAFGFGFYHPVGFIVNNRGMLGVNMLKIADHRPGIIETCMSEVMELASLGKLNPVVGKVFDASEFAQAHAFLESRQSTGKIAVIW